MDLRRLHCPIKEAVVFATWTWGQETRWTTWKLQWLPGRVQASERLKQQITSVLKAGRVRCRWLETRHLHPTDTRKTQAVQIRLNFRYTVSLLSMFRAILCCSSEIYNYLSILCFDLPHLTTLPYLDLSTKPASQTVGEKERRAFLHMPTLKIQIAWENIEWLRFPTVSWIKLSSKRQDWGPRFKLILKTKENDHFVREFCGWAHLICFRWNFTTALWGRQGKYLWCQQGWSWSSETLSDVRQSHNLTSGWLNPLQKSVPLAYLPQRTFYLCGETWII